MIRRKRGNQTGLALGLLVLKKTRVPLFSRGADLTFPANHKTQGGWVAGELTPKHKTQGAGKEVRNPLERIRTDSHGFHGFHGFEADSMDSTDSQQKFITRAQNPHPR